jgi:hypothetical protein
MAKQLQSMAPGIDLNPAMEAVWSIPLPAFPPQKSTMDKLTKGDKDAAEKILGETMVSDGQTTHVITSESSKINLNYLEIPDGQKDQPFNFTKKPTTLVEYVAMTLVNLIEGFIKDSDSPNEEYPDLKPEELVSDIMDWVNPGNTRLMGGSKDAYYEQQTPPYKAKRGRFFTLDVLKLVKGVDDKIFRKLKPHVTVYSYDGKINLNSATREMYRALYPDFTDDDLKRILEEKARITNWPNEQAFVDFVTNTLGRSGFKQLYGDAKNYPFTTSSYSFLIESSGMIQRSKTTVQRNIKVAVALTRGKGGQFDLNITDPVACNKDKNKFWLDYVSRCTVRPRSAAECIPLGGGWQVNPATGKFACHITNGPFVDPPAADAEVQEPNSVKILYWQET